MRAYKAKDTLTSARGAGCLAPALTITPGSLSREEVGASDSFISASASVDGGLLEGWGGCNSTSSELVGDDDCEGPVVGPNEIDGDGVLVGDGVIVG